MPKISAPLTRTMRLIDYGLPIDLDENGESTVTFRQATQRDVQERAELTADAQRAVTESGIMVRQRWNIEEQKALEVFLTLAGAKDIDLEDPFNLGSFKPAFRFSKVNGVTRVADRDEFMESWGRLPEEWASAIHSACIAVNVQWDPTRRR